MPVAVLDTTVLYAAADRSDARHDDGLPLIRGIDDGTLPEGSVVEYVLAETVNGLVRNLSNEAAVDYLERIEANDRLDIGRLTADAFATGKAVFRRHEGLSLVDGLIVGYMRDREIEYLYSFDAGFDAVDGITQLSTVDNPYASD
jgi:predicted nucleic acid-binding protein